MLQLDLIHEFLDKKVIAVVGVSRNGDLPANHIYQKFKQLGYETYQVNPNSEEIDGDKCYPDLGGLPSKAEAVLLGGRPEVSSTTIDECGELDIPIVWMHKGFGQGSYSEEAVEKCNKAGIKAIVNGCPLMFLGKVDPFHKVLRWFKKF